MLDCRESSKLEYSWTYYGTQPKDLEACVYVQGHIKLVILQKNWMKTQTYMNTKNNKYMLILMMKK